MRIKELNVYNSNSYIHEYYCIFRHLKWEIKCFYWNMAYFLFIGTQYSCMFGNIFSLMFATVIKFSTLNDDRIELLSSLECCQKNTTIQLKCLQSPPDNSKNWYGLCKTHTNLSWTMLQLFGFGRMQWSANRTLPNVTPFPLPVSYTHLCRLV